MSEGESQNCRTYVYYLWLTRRGVFVINGAWQLGDKLLTTDQGRAGSMAGTPCGFYNRRVNCFQ